MFTITLSKENKSQTFNCGNNITKIFIRNISTNIRQHDLNKYDITYKLKGKIGNEVTNNFTIDKYITNTPYISTQWIDNGIIGNFPLPIVSIEFISVMELDYEIIHIDLQFENIIDVTSPTKNFIDHLSFINNPRILFSAPFGQGKTTFLKLFFEEHDKDYNTFHIFPINYAISENKDIFEYIKFGLLYELLERDDIIFQNIEIGYLKTIPKFALKNADKLLAPFLRLIPSIGGDLFAIYENLRKLSDELFEFHDSQQSNQKEKAKNYIESYFMKEGSIYENNFFTQLIRQLLKQLKEDSNKENVLIIDDLDRIDPEHIFRILNVFAAHFDDNNYFQRSNKFGFDRIILVCDYSNLSKIFAHKFGDKTDFPGYINKFFTRSVFRYNNFESALYLIDHIKALNTNSEYSLEVILKDLFLTGSLSLRELFILSKHNFSADPPKKKLNKTNQELISNLRNLISIFDSTFFKHKIQNCIDYITEEKCVPKANYNYLTKDAIIELYYDSIKDNKISFTYGNKKLIIETIKSSMSYYNYLEPQKMYLSDSTTSEDHLDFEFNFKDYYTILLEIINKHERKLI